MPENDAKPLHGEQAIIAEFLTPLAAGFPGALGLKDDCAVFAPSPGMEIVLKTDPIAEGVHFLSDDDPADIGWKALAVNVSDLAAKGAMPRAYLMALSFPLAPTRAWMTAFARGLGEAQVAFGIQLAGGDTDRRPGPITVSITVLGEVPAGRMVRRATARPGDLLYVTGQLGRGALGLALHRDPILAQRWRVSTADAAAEVRRFHRPEPRLALREALLGHASAAMDLSDGLVKDLGRMAKASGCGAQVLASLVPRSAVGNAAIADDPEHWASILATGDDYEVLAAVPPDRARHFEDLAAASPFPVTRIGEMTAGGRVEILGADGTPLTFDRTGWDHF
ncbi:MAG: thiamine-phosphate kinase [Proteobacteria bacterium]|nr:thiamine-phosphate kinase [Pseudomonadota bacterium]